MAGGEVIYEMMSASGMMSLGLYHSITCTIHFLRSPPSYIAKPFHPLSNSNSNSNSGSGGGGGRWWWRNYQLLPLYLAMLFLLISISHQLILSSQSDPLVKGRTPVHRFTSLQYAAVLFLFLILCVSLVISLTTSLLPLPSDLFFAISSSFFFLLSYLSSSSASFQTSSLQAKCDSLASLISSLSSFLCLLLACQPRLFVADLLLGASFSLQGLWILQSALSLYVDAFIPEGCHRLLDVVSGVEGSTMCDFDESKLRAIALLDLAFVIHVMFVLLIVMVIYAAVAGTVGIRRLGSYEALPITTSPDSNNTHLHIQMKALTGTQA